MNGDAMDARLHDYLDGRLSEDERRELEARLARDPRLAERLAAYRELGEAVREAHGDVPVDLPPGFHARARARFEATRRPRRGWGRLLSWEATGLAAAAVLLAAILLPVLLERPDLEALRPRAEPRGSAVEHTPAEAEEQRQRPADAVSKNEAARAAATERSDTDAADTGPARREPAGDLGKPDSERFAPVPGEDRSLSAPTPGAKVSPEPESDARLDEAGAPPAPAEPETSPRKRARSASEPAATPGQRERMDKSAASTDDALESLGYAGPEPGEDGPGRVEGFARAPGRDERLERPRVARPIDAGALARDEVRVIDDERALRRFVEEASHAGEDPLRPDFSRERLVLIGPRGIAVECASAELLDRPDRLVIVLTARADEAAVPGACAVVVPRADRPVDVVVRARDGR